MAGDRVRKRDDVFTGAGELARALGALEVTVERVSCRSGLVAVDDYPGGRPATVVEVAGQGHRGFGELVSFTRDEHLAFAARLTGMLGPGRGRVEELVRSDPPHERAAVEAALIDLGLRQAGLSPGQLWGAEEASLRWVVSLSALADPLSRIAHQLARPAGEGERGGTSPPARTELKLDVHDGWTDDVIQGLRAQRVVTLDFKDRGTLALAHRLSRVFPDVIFEDPPPGCRHLHIARDRPLAVIEDVAAAVARGEWVNLKAPRMGGFLALLRAMEVAGGRAYIGGMFEVGPGREQARQLAAMFCPDAPNDLAPFAGGRSSLQGPSPSGIRLDRPGFGANLDWSSFLAA